MPYFLSLLLTILQAQSGLQSWNFTCPVRILQVSDIGLVLSFEDCWYCTLLSENPSISYNSPLVNQKPVCYFKSKYPVNMTDEEWLQVWKKRFKFLSSSLPPYVHMVGGKGGCIFATVKCLLLVVIWQYFLCGFNFSCSWRHCIQILQIRVWSARNDATSDNWVLPIIKCPPVVRHVTSRCWTCPGNWTIAWLPNAQHSTC